MNAFAEGECLDTRLARIARLENAGEIGAMRQALEDMLRCSAKLGCGQAVACSDGARAGILQLLNAG